MPKPQSFAVGVDRLLECIRPYGGWESCFPQGLNGAEPRRGKSESLHDWFARLVKHCCYDDPTLAGVEDTLAVFVQLKWSKTKVLTYACIQSLYTTADLEKYLLDDLAEAIYLRLDLDYQSLGDPFSHPLPHIHIEGDLSPRFALEGGSGNIVLDFLEFLYRNYFPEKWFAWVAEIWRNEFAPFAKENPDPLPTIKEAFAAGNFQKLRECAVQIEQIKNAVRKRKDEIFALVMNGQDRIILEYPLAR